MTKKEEITVIIQARIGSTRLPGKSMKIIEGKPMLWHVVNRLKQCRFVDKIIIATTTGIKDDAIVSFCESNGFDYYRGSEDDVLNRYYEAAKKYGAKNIARITSDCPLIDPFIVDKVVSAYLNQKDSYDGASNVIRRTFPQGLDTEVLSFKTLERGNKEATKSSEREHVTTYFYNNHDKFKFLSVEHDKNLSHLRWTVDEKADMKFVRSVYKSLFQPKKIFLMQDVLDLLEKEPRLILINNNVKQKSAE